MSVGRVTAKTKIFEIKIELREVRPAVLRRVQVPGDMTLAGLHAVVQVAMGWTDSHLHEFDVDGVRYGLPDPDWDVDEVRDEARAKLFRLLGQGDRVGYVYDFGDGWTHRLTVEKVLAPEPGVSYPRCVSGRRACPPEDVGGPWGYDEFLAAMADLAHPEHEHYREWQGGPFDPAAFDLDAVNQALAELAWSPLIARVGSSGSTRGAG
jgi:Plasmid pRiA4b ORF-3-like protein